MQKLFSNTLYSEFIQAFLRNTFVPKISTVVDGDLVVCDSKYLYNGKVIYCTQSGVMPNVSYTDVDVFTESNETCEKYISKHNFYDTDTHTYLGKYLEYMRDSYDIDLLHLYNLFSGSEISDAFLSPASSSTVNHINYSENDFYRIYSVPIRFGRKYSIYMDCESEASLGCMVRNKYGPITIDGLGYIYSKDASGNSVKKAYKPNVDELLPSSHYVRVGSTQFNIPYVYSVGYPTSSAISKLTYEKALKILKDNEKYLRLIIQVPKSSTSSIVVLNGDYSKSYNNRIILNSEIFSKSYDTYSLRSFVKDKTSMSAIVNSSIEWKTNIPENSFIDTNISSSKVNKIMNELDILKLNKYFSSDRRLTFYNDKQMYAYSDKLVEYLLLSVINPLDELDSNFQYAGNRVDSENIKNYTTFTNYLRYLIYKISLADKNIDRYDLNGFVDVQSEIAIYNYYIKSLRSSTSSATQALVDFSYINKCRIAEILGV